MTRLAIFTYHYIIDANNPLQKDIFGPSKKSFEEQIQFFKKKYNIISPEEIDNFFLTDNYQEEDLCVCLTFDDGLNEHGRYVSEFLDSCEINGLFFVPEGIVEGFPPIPPILHYSLARYRLPTVIKWLNEGLEDMCSSKKFEYSTIANHQNMISQLKKFFRFGLKKSVAYQAVLYIFRQGLQKEYPDIMNRLFLTNNDIKAMIEKGHIIGGHTRTHPSLNGELDSKILDVEIIQSLKKLKKITGSTIKHFAFPYGAQDDCSEYYNDTLQELGVQYAYTTTGILNTTKTNHLRISRKSIYQNDNLDSIKYYIETQFQSF